MNLERLSELASILRMLNESAFGEIVEDETHKARCNETLKSLESLFCEEVDTLTKDAVA